ncbi:MAG: hypothetical protein ABW000_05520 [Actinoplanes sp.]
MVPPALRRRPFTARTLPVFLLVAALFGGVAMTGCTPAATLGAGQVPVAEPHQHVLAGALHERTAASLVVRDAASRVEVRLSELPGLLYRITTPAESGLAPVVTGTPGRVRLGLRPTGADGPDTVMITLNSGVRWDLRLPAGAGEQHLDLAAGRVRRLEIGSGTGLVNLWLPPPQGVVPIILAGGMGEIAVTVPARTSLRFRLRGGAGLVTVPWADRGRARPGTMVTPVGWRQATDRYAVDVATEIGTVTLRG